jgi:hypothetical protein
VKRIALIRVVSFLLLAASGALCQSERSSADLRRGDGSNSTQVQSQKMATLKSLPDAPSVDEARLPLIPGTIGINAFTPGLRSSLAAAYVVVAPTDSSTFFDKYLYPSLLKRNQRYRPATGGSFMRRATDAASRIFITRDDSGKARLNDSYFSGVLTSVVVQTAYSPYWTRSATTPFSNFGSRIGSDAGLNVFHEFEPGIRQMLNGHTPKFLSRIEERIAQDRSPKEVLSSPR